MSFDVDDTQSFVLPYPASTVSSPSGRLMERDPSGIPRDWLRVSLLRIRGVLHMAAYRVRSGGEGVE